MSKKKFKDTKIGSFLIGAGSTLANGLLESVPDKGVLGLVKNLIVKDKSMSQQDKDIALKMLEMDIQEMKSVSARWESDMSSDSTLSKNVRPLTLIFLTLFLALLIFCDSTFANFQFDQAWIDLLKTLNTTIYVAYFGSRGFEKYKKISNG